MLIDEDAKMFFYSWAFCKEAMQKRQLCFNFFRALASFQNLCHVIAWTGSTFILISICYISWNLWCGATWPGERLFLASLPIPQVHLLLCASAEVRFACWGIPLAMLLQLNIERLHLIAWLLKIEEQGFDGFLHLPVDAEIDLSSPILFVRSYAFLIFAGAHKPIRIEFKSRR